jgi:hypothetical protein
MTAADLFPELHWEHFKFCPVLFFAASQAILSSSTEHPWKIQCILTTTSRDTRYSTPGSAKMLGKISNKLANSLCHIVEIDILPELFAMCGCGVNYNAS